MFYCNDCARRRDWPQQLNRSYQQCDLCKQHRICSYRAADPAPPATPDRKTKRDRKTRHGQL